MPDRLIAIVGSTTVTSASLKIPTSAPRAIHRKRRNGLPDFQIYHFVNPSKLQQTYEQIAYGEDQEWNGNPFALVRAIAAARKTLNSAADYRAGLQAQKHSNSLVGLCARCMR